MSVKIVKQNWNHEMRPLEEVLKEIERRNKNESDDSD
jgi:hypothetical protein